mgnify:CR=1 FL=1
MNLTNETKSKRKEVIAFSIFITHIKRIGIFRTFIGGGFMYLSIVEFVFIHLTAIVVLYQWMLTPFFKVKKFAVKDYIHLDRGRIDGMTFFDKFNCHFCAYANGSVKLWNDQLDEISIADLGKGRYSGKLIVLMFSLCMMAFLVFNFIFSKVLFGIISLFLGYHRVGSKEIKSRLETENYAGSYIAPLRGIIRFAKLYARILSLNLEQIESNWCPLKHIETSTSVFPEHHQNFYDRNNLKGALKALGSEGSVSPRKLKY